LAVVSEEQWSLEAGQEEQWLSPVGQVGEWFPEKVSMGLDESSPAVPHGLGPVSNT
jgi:hypothetical protein